MGYLQRGNPRSRVDYWIFVLRAAAIDENHEVRLAEDIVKRSKGQLLALRERVAKEQKGESDDGLNRNNL